MDTSRIVVPAAEEVMHRYFPVHNYGFVALVDYMGGDEAIERAARTSYHAVGEEERTEGQRKTLLRLLFRKRHASPFEMCELTLHLGLPIFAMRQLVRHRTSHLNEFSQRYSPVPLLYYTPDRDHFRLQSMTNKQGGGRNADEEDYEQFVADVTHLRQESASFYKTNLKVRIARETSRIDLPLSTYTYVYWKMDMRNFLHLIGLRSDPHAQQEIRDYSNLFAGIAKRVAPLTFDAFQDYQQTAVSFTQVEMQALECLHACDKSDDVATRFLTEAGVSKREIGEFFDKLKPRPKADYTLDPADARDAAYYQQLVTKYAAEGVPEGDS